MILQDIEALSDAEKLALVKALQENVASSKAKQVSLEAGQYAKLVVDAIKKIKTDLEERYAAISADITAKAASIRDGVDGISALLGSVTVLIGRILPVTGSASSGAVLIGLGTASSLTV